MPLSIPSLTERQIVHFNASFVRREGGCWEWSGSRNGGGYGRIKLRGRYMFAHRVSFAVHNGRDPADLLVCHACDNPPRVNPNHLWLGTVQDNTRDAIAKGRMRVSLTHCLKCGHHRTDDLPARRGTPARCRSCKRISKMHQKRAMRLRVRKG